MDRNSQQLFVLSELQLALNQDVSSISYRKNTDRRSLGNKGSYHNLDIKKHSTTNTPQQIRIIQQRINNIQKKLQVILIKISQIIKDQSGSNSHKLHQVNKKYDKIQYQVWQMKQINKQNRDINQSLRSKIIQNKQTTDKNISILKTNNHLLLSTMQSVLEELIQKVQVNKTDTTHQLKKICQAMEDICQYQTKIQINNKGNQRQRSVQQSYIKYNDPFGQQYGDKMFHKSKQTMVVKQASALNQSSIYEIVKQRRSLPLRHSVSNNPRKTMSNIKKTHVKKKNSIF